MKRASGDRPGPRLRGDWRKGLVTVLASSAVSLAILHLAVPDRTRVTYSVSIGLTLVILGCLWLLADTLWPWVGGDAVHPEHRAHADAALRRSYEVLFTIAVGVLVYLLAADARPALLPDGEDHALSILWTSIALVVLLPVCIAAWDDPVGDDPTTTVSPVGLVRARFSGPSAGLFAGSLLATVTAALVAALGVGIVGTGEGPLYRIVVLVAVAVVAAVSALLLRLVVAERRRHEHDPRR